MESTDPLSHLATSRRILVLGSSGSGKTTFSIQLGEILDLDPIHLDAHFWRPGWRATPRSEWRDVVAELVQRDAWIMDGTYESSLDLRIPPADLVILVKQSRWVCLWRAAKRKLTIDDHHRPDAPAGQKLDVAFLRYIWRYPKVTHPFVLEEIRRHGADKPVIELQGSSQMRRLLQQLKQRSSQSAGSRNRSSGP
jgi:adenylate kinase family enzyme